MRRGSVGKRRRLTRQRSSLEGLARGAEHATKVTRGAQPNPIKRGLASGSVIGVAIPTPQELLTDVTVLAWWNAGLGYTRIGNKIDAWADQIQDIDLLAVSASTRCLFDPSNAELAGHPTVNGVRDEMRRLITGTLASALLDTTEPAEMIIVGRWSRDWVGPNSSAAVSLSNGIGGGGPIYGMGSSLFATGRVRCIVDQSGGIDILADPTVATVQSIQHTPGNPTGFRFEAYGQYGVRSAGTRSVPISAVHFASYNAGVADFSDFEIAELLILAGVASAATRADYVSQRAQPLFGARL